MRTLKVARILFGYTQEQLAKYVGITAQQLSNIETGRSYPRKSTREKFEKKLSLIDWRETYEMGKLNKKKLHKC